MRAALLGALAGLALGLSLLVGLLWLNSQVSGWARLATRYRWDGEVQGSQWKWRSLGFSWLSWYNNCVTVTATARGLSLRIQPFLRAFHPPMLIPWDRFTAARPWGAGLMRGVALTLGQDSAQIIFKWRQYARMQGDFPSRLRVTGP